MFPALLGAQSAHPQASSFLRNAPGTPGRQYTQAELAALEWAAYNRNYPRANVDGIIITMFDVHKGVTPLVQGLRREAEGNDAVFSRQLNILITQTVQGLSDRKLLVKEFREKGGTIPASLITAQIDEKIQQQYSGDRAEYLNVLKRQGTSQIEDRQLTEEFLIVDYMQKDILKPAGEVSPRRIVAYYEDNKQKEFVRTEQVRYRQLTLTPGAVDTNEDIRNLAQRISGELKNGVAFSALVKQYSRDDLRNDDGGGALWRDPSGLNEKISTAIKALPNNATTEPMEFAWPDGRVFICFFQRVDYRPGGLVPLDEVQEQIARELAEQERKFVFEATMSRLRQKFFVRYY
jgi:hypothetical protein